jgi:competence protein ComFC
MKRTFLRILEIIFPMRADAQIVAASNHVDIQKVYRCGTSKDISWLLPFVDARVRACIHEIKFHENQKAAHLLGTAFQRYIETVPAEHCVIIPVPLSKERRKQRGHNQVVSILKYVKEVNIEKNILFKTRDTTPQTRLSRKKRLENVVDVYGINDTTYASKKVEGKHIILLDDVFTTGATLKAAKRALSPLSPASITCVALAH